jgi:hypothetical protein
MERGRSIVRVLVPLIAIAIGVSGCASMSQNLADKMSQAPAIGLPADTPARPAANSVSYPAVHDIPPPRNSVMLTDFEQRKMEDDLVEARDHQQAALGVPVQKKKTPPSKASQAKTSRARTSPAATSEDAAPARASSASQTIY